MLQPVQGAGPAAVAAEGSLFEKGVAEDSKRLGMWRYKGNLLLILDAVTVSSCFMLAYFLRFKWPVIGTPLVPTPNILSYVQGAFLLALFWVFLVWRGRGYENGLMGSESLIHKIRTIFIAGLYALGCLMVISFLFRSLLLSRMVYSMTSVLAFGIMCLTRVLFRAIDQDLAAQGKVAYRILLAGTSPQSAEFATRLAASPSLCEVVGMVKLEDDEEAPESYEGIPVLGELGRIREIHERIPFDQLVLPNAMENRDQRFMEVLNFCEAEDISLYTLPNHFHIAVDQQEVGSFSGLPMILMRDAAMRPAYAVVKRCMDLVVASLVLAAGLPVWLALCLLVKLYDRGPIFFVQERAGLHGRPFPMYKFRSMVADADQELKNLVDLDALDEPVFKIRNDPRVTPVGRFLRRTSLDEIPQLINVLKGEMSLVGPRPEEMGMVDLYTPWQRRRLKAVPGITGHQQIHNRGEPSLARRIQFDLIYVKHQSLLLDLYIMLKTVKVVIFGSGTTH